MKAIGRIQSLAIAGVLILAIAVGGWFALIQPAKNKVTNLKAEAASQESDNTSLSLQVANLKALAKHLPQEEAALAQIKKKVPDQVEVANLLRQLVAAASTSGVNLTSLTPQAPQPLTGAQGIGYVDLQLTFSGGYAEIEQFDAALEALSRTLLVKSFTLSDSTAGAASTSDSKTSSGSVATGTDITATFQGRVLVKDTTSGAASTPTPAAATTAPTKS